jgi:hypothetical protein
MPTPRLKKRPSVVIVTVSEMVVVVHAPESDVFGVGFSSRNVGNKA